jgi:uridine monophosphate synthetase
MTSKATPSHPTWTLSFSQRAQLPNTTPLAAYLLHLIAIKKSNLCLSADVSTSTQLLKLAEDTGDSICLLKTHADIVTDWSDRTVRQLREIAKAKGFLVFEDRKFSDIGSMYPHPHTPAAFPAHNFPQARCNANTPLALSA